MLSQGQSRRIVLAGMLAAPALLVRKARAADPLRIRIQGVGATFTALTEIYARSLGLYEQHGLAAEYLPPIYNANGIMQVVVQGTADIASTGGSSIIQAVQQGRRVKCIGVGMLGLELKVSLTKPGQEKVSKLGITTASPPMERVRALRGLRLAAPGTGSTSDTAFRYSLKRAGIDPTRDVIIQPMGDAGSMLAAARAGAVDALVGVAATANGRAEAEGTATRFIAFEEDDAVLQNYPTTIMAVTDEFLQKNQEAVRRFLASMHDARKAIRRGLTEAELTTMKQKFFPDMSDANWTTSLRQTIPQFSGSLTPVRAQYDALMLTNNAQAEVPATVTFEQCFDPSLAAVVEKG